MARKVAHTKKRRKSRNNRIIRLLVSIALAVGIFFNLLNLLKGDESIFFVNKVKQEIAVVTASIQEKQRENSLIKTRIKLLKNDPQIIEEAARQRLNLVKEGETLFIFPRQK